MANFMVAGAGWMGEAAVYGEASSRATAAARQC